MLPCGVSNFVSSPRLNDCNHCNPPRRYRGKGGPRGVAARNLNNIATSVQFITTSVQFIATSIQFIATSVSSLLQVFSLLLQMYFEGLLGWI